MIDYKPLERALHEMTPRSKLFEIVKKEMMARGRWKMLGRGKPYKSVDGEKKLNK